MDFLRRLAPVRDTDPSRAQAVLPSRFSVWQPLQETPDRAATPQRFDEGDANDRSAVDVPLEAGNPAGVQRHAEIDVQGVWPAPTGPFVKPESGEQQRPMSLVRASDKPSGTPAIPHARTVPDATSLAERSPTLRSLPRSPATAEVKTRPMIQAPGAPHSQPVDTGPLSQASLAQRTVPSHDDNPVVHVTIGRIDVVTQPAPAPAPSRSPAPRQPSVTLAEYLQGHHRHHGGRS